MAVGVPENEVFAAADAVLARGERPTVERVRLELGRGSPARVGGLLDQWWARLAERLNGETRLPALPAEVAQAFVAIWQQAIHLAQGVAEQSLDQHRQVLAAERERVAVIEGQARQDAAQFRQQTAEALAGAATAELGGLIWTNCWPSAGRRSRSCSNNVAPCNWTATPCNSSAGSASRAARHPAPGRARTAGAGCLRAGRRGPWLPRN